jgi:putative ABC transport system substrate-binding protein
MVVPTSEAAIAVRKVAPAVPVAGTFLGDPVRFGLAQSYAHPGGNVTGLTSEAGGLPIAVKVLEFLKLALPGATRPAVRLNSASELAVTVFSDVESAARAVNLRVVRVEARTPEQLEQAFSRMQQERVDALHMLGDVTFFAQRARIAAPAGKHRLPSGGAMPHYAQAGGLINYVMDASDNCRRAADFVDKILKGAKPGDLSIEQLTKFQLVVNAGTARALGIALPRELLLRADQVIDLVNPADGDRTGPISRT